ncbi:DUF1398 family protein [Streptomyces bauhiniae]|uniref:DUF1398 family protein n=1 Tax=Streptomyces bauhiniae TaxID=2340725 RepID=UPI0036BB9845
MRDDRAVERDALPHRCRSRGRPGRAPAHRHVRRTAVRSRGAGRRAARRQAGETAFPEFVRGCWQAGVVRYDVDLAARTCTYYGAGEESYVETYPEVAL